MLSLKDCKTFPMAWQSRRWVHLEFYLISWGFICLQAPSLPINFVLCCASFLDISISANHHMHFTFYQARNAVTQSTIFCLMRRACHTLKWNFHGAVSTSGWWNAGYEYIGAPKSTWLVSLNANVTGFLSFSLQVPITAASWQHDVLLLLEYLMGDNSGLSQGQW